MIDKLKKEDFDGHLESTLTVQLEEEGSCELKLEEVTHIGAKQARGASRHAFSVLFSGAEDLHLEQRIYRIEHPEIGELDLFLVPLGPDPKDGRSLFEAVFT